MINQGQTSIISCNKIFKYREFILQFQNSGH